MVDTTTTVDTKKQAVILEATKKISKELKTSDAVKSLLNSLVEAGLFVKSEIIKAVVTEYPAIKEITVSTYLTDSKNSKYNRLSGLTFEDAKSKVFKFQAPVAITNK